MRDALMTADNMHLEARPSLCERVSPDDLYLFASEGCSEAEIVAYAGPMNWTPKQEFAAKVRFVITEVRSR